MDQDADLDSEWTDENNAGANYANFARQLLYDRTSYMGNNSYYASFSTIVNRGPDNTLVEFEDKLPDSALKPYGNTKFETARKDQTTLFLIDSKNRDRAAYPQPTSFTLKPPRVYQNVASIQVTEIKLLSSFFYFRAAKGNTFLPVIERGREKINNFLGFPLTYNVQVAEGSYNIGDLLNTLQIQMNYTPLFYDYPTGFAGFVNAFTANGDLSVNFNQPGDTYYDALNKKYLSNPTMDQITSYYWGSRYAGLTQYTVDQVKVAYYYPVLYEVFLDTTDTLVYPFLNLNLPSGLLENGDTVYTHIIFNSTGINDPILLILIDQNITLLDTYRLHHTFRFFLINRYQVAYDTNSLRVNIVTLSLNTSLINLINLTNARNLTTIIQNIGLTPQTFSNTSNTLNQAKVVFADMYNYIQTQLTTYFAVNYATFAAQYFLNMDNVIFIQNGLNAEGVRTGYTTEYLQSGQQPIASTVALYSNSPGYWPNFISANTYLSGMTSPLGGGINSDGINPSTSMVPYSIGSSNFQFGLQTIDSSNFFIQTSRATRSVDCLATIHPAQYTVFKFRSQVRQTLQVETLPLPYYYRFAGYNQQGFIKGILDPDNLNVPQTYFSTPYEFLYQSTNQLMDSSNYNSVQLQDIASRPFQTAFISSPVLNLNVQSNFAQLEFIAPWPPGVVSTGLYCYNTSLSFIGVNQASPAISTNLGTNVQAYVYHDRAAFMADLATPYRRKENPLHYIISSSATTDSSDLTIHISTFSGQRYYSIFRSAGLAFANMSYRPVVYTDTNYVNIRTDYIDFSPFDNPSVGSNPTNFPFVENYNSNYLQLPIGSTLQGIDPSDPRYKISVSVKGKPIGYDISGVSDDLTDYRGYISGQPGFIPDTIFRIDPTNTFTFQAITPFDPVTGSYFDEGTENSILEPVTNEVYNYKGTTASQIKIVHWYDDYFIPKQLDDNITTTSTIGFSPYVCSIQDYVTGYPLDTNGNIQFGRGINSIGFLPTDGVYNVSSFTFKSAIYPLGGTEPSVEDPNTAIQYMGVFTGSYLASKFIAISSALTVLKFTQSKVYAPSTLSNTPGFGVEFGTWYEFGYDPSFVALSNVNLNGYTQASNELVSYDSMYYMVPFNAAGSNLTFTNLTGSLLPYPLTQVVSTGSTYFGQTVKSIVGTTPQRQYITPSTVANAYAPYGPQGLIPYTQSQYEQSLPIMTNSIGFREFQKLVINQFALFPFRTTFSNTQGLITAANIGLTTFMSEYSDTLYLVNSLSNMTNISNVLFTNQGATYASSISTTISVHGGNLSSMQFLLNAPSTLNNYPYVGLSNFYSTFLFQKMDSDGPNSNITTRRLNIDLNVNTPYITAWLWGGGGGTWTGSPPVAAPSNQMGGAGAYAKVQINIQTLASEYGVSTLYLVVGKGGNRDNATFSSNGSIQGYEQPRYGGGGTSLIETDPTSPATNNIHIQGGGFTGIFLGSNLTTALPLVIVGGGGAGGAYTMGGPGGFGITPIPLPVETFPFSNATLTTLIYDKIIATSAFDWSSVYQNSPTTNWGVSFRTNPASFTQSKAVATSWIVDQDYGTFSLARPFLNNEFYTGLNGFTMRPGAPGQQTAQAEAVGLNQFSLNFGSNISSIGKVRVYSFQPTGNGSLPIGFAIYNDINKSQMLYSNFAWDITGSIGTILLSNYWGTPAQPSTALQVVYELPITQEIINTPLVTSGWVACGVNKSQFDTLQYSLDGSNWVNIRSQTGPPGFVALTSTSSVAFAGTVGNQWYACGSNTIIRSSNGLDWSASGITIPYTGGSLNTLVVGSNYMLVGGAPAAGTSNSILRTTNGTTWSNTTNGFGFTVTNLRYTFPLVWAMSPIASPSLKYSLTGGVSWTNVATGVGILTGARDIAFDGLTTYVVAMGTGAAPLNSPLVYGTAASILLPPTAWTAAFNMNLSNFTCNSVCYGNGVFVAGGSTSDGTSPMKFSADGINWFDTDVIPQTPTVFAAARGSGTTPDGYHPAGTTRYPFYSAARLYDMIIFNITFDSNTNSFLSSGRGTTIWFGGAAGNNQLSIMRSINGQNWSLSFQGGYNNNYDNSGVFAAALSGGYGPLTIVPNLSTIYVEIATYFAEFSGIGEIEVYSKGYILPSQTASNTVSTIYDNNLTTYWWPDENTVASKSITDYTLTLNLSTTQALLSKLRFYTPNDSSRYFTGLTMSLDNTANNAFINNLITPLDFQYDPERNVSYYDAIFVPPLFNVSTVYMNINKTTVSSLQINEIRAENDPNKPINFYIPNTVTFAYATADGFPDNTDTLDGFPITNMTDGNLATRWRAGFRPNPGFPVNCTYEINFSFNTPIPRINYIQFYTAAYEFGYNGNGVSGVVVYANSSKLSVLYSNVLSAQYTTLGVNQYGYQMIGFNIIPYTDVSNIYIEFIANTVNSGNPLSINEIYFVNVGLNLDTPAGYTGGTITAMQRITVANQQYDGGGGSNGIGGVGGADMYTSNAGPTIIATNGLSGTYLKGGSPASAGEIGSNGASSYSNMVFSAGGGGGGYYGGGGGGIASYNASGYNVYEGGAGGGGAGYFIPSTNLITLLDYGVAVPGNVITQTPSNYFPPKKTVQDALIGSNQMVPYSNALGYGAGAIQTNDTGRGAHGAIVLNFDAPAVVQPIGRASQTPAFVDGSKLGLFQAPISYESDIRILPFTAYKDPIQLSPFSNYNWVWYKSYLDLPGSTLDPKTMKATTQEPQPPLRKYPGLPAIVYTSIEDQFYNVSSFFNGKTSTAVSVPIIEGLEVSFQLFNQYFINTPYTDPKYNTYTQVYCLLDYLRGQSNLLNPHVDSITSPLNRVFGGLPGHGYWANPFLTNVSYVGFDTGPSLKAPFQLSTISGSSETVTAFYGLALEQNLSSGVYTMKNIMAYKPTLADASNHGSNWLKVTQFNESYIVNSLSNPYIASNIPVQPYTLQSAIGGNLPLLNYKVYTAPIPIGDKVAEAPIQMINDFQGQYAYLYTFQNFNQADLSTVHFTQIPLTSSIIQVNQLNVTNLSNAASNIIGTVVSENYGAAGSPSTNLQAVTQFGFNLDPANLNPLNPVINFNTGPSNYYNRYSVNSPIKASNVGKGMTDYIGNLFVTDRLGTSNLYENVCTIQIFQQPFSNQNIKSASPSLILNEYRAGNSNPYYDYLVSRSQNIWQLQGTQNLSTIFGARLISPYDFTVITNFANQIFYPSHKIILNKTATGTNPIQNTTDLTNYPSYPKTQSFFYNNFSSLVQDISGQFALENKNNFEFADTQFAGYFFNSYIQNINMAESTNFNNANKDSFNYLAIRAYSPSESFKCLVRFYLPGRYDFGYISLTDLSNEILTLQSNTNVNPDYLEVLGEFTSSFAITRVFGGVGLPGYSGSNITSVTFGDFLSKYRSVQGIITSNSGTINTVINSVIAGQKALITGDLQYIIPPYVATRERVYDPLEFSLPFSTIVQASNRTIEEYGMGYNLGFFQKDTGFNTNQRAGSFFKILDDYIYMKMNPEHNMNRLDISRQENYSVSHDTQAESRLYNCKLILNNFGTYATTLVQNPVLFNPPIGKLDKLIFAWYDRNGALINNDECEWSGSIQVVETVDVATADSVIRKM